jgi:hypothetical protein
MTTTAGGPSRRTRVVIWIVGAVVGVVVALTADDVILGVGVGAALVAICVGLGRLWVGDSTRPRHP